MQKAFEPCWAKHAPEELQQPTSSKHMPASIRQNWSRKRPVKNCFRILLGEACLEELQQPASSKPMPASIRKNWSRKGPVTNSFRILLGEACSRRAAATDCIFAVAGLIKTDAGQYLQKLVKERACDNSLSDPVGRSMPPKELQQPDSSKLMPASIHKNLSRKGPVKIRFRILLSEACSRRAAATGLINSDAGQYSLKLVKERACEKSLSDAVGRSMLPKSCSNRLHFRSDRPHQNRCRPVFAKTGQGKGL
jgi:hypothetical protein